MTQKHTPELIATYQKGNGWVPCIKAGNKVIWSCDRGFTNRTETSYTNWSAKSRAQTILSLAMKSEQEAEDALLKMKLVKTGSFGAEVTDPRLVARKEWAVEQAKFARAAIAKATGAA